MDFCPDSSTDVSAPHKFFIVHTRGGTQKRYNSETELQTAAKRLGFNLALRSTTSVYSDNRISFFDYFTLFLQIGVSAMYFWELRRWIKELRKKP